MLSYKRNLNPLIVADVSFDSVIIPDKKSQAKRLKLRVDGQELRFEKSSYLESSIL